MRNKNAQNNGKDGEYGEGKNEKEKRAENRPRNFMETALAACDVSTICNLADYLQVHSAVGMDHGISGGKTGNVLTSDLGENRRVSKVALGSMPSRKMEASEALTEA